MKYIILFALPLSLALMYACGTNDVKHTENSNSVSKVDFQIIKTGVLHGAGEEGFSQGAISVSNMEEFQAIREKMNSVNQELEDDIIPNLHFFDEEMLVFVFDKVRGTGGYTFEVEEIIDVKDTLKVRVLSKRPSGPAMSVMTQPYQVVSILKSDKALFLELIE